MPPKDPPLAAALQSARSDWILLPPGLHHDERWVPYSLCSWFHVVWKTVWAGWFTEDHISYPFPSPSILIHSLIFSSVAFLSSSFSSHPSLPSSSIFLHFNTLITFILFLSLTVSLSFLPFSTLPLSHHTTPSLACCPVSPHSSSLPLLPTPFPLPPHCVLYSLTSITPPNLSSPLYSVTDWVVAVSEWS